MTQFGEYRRVAYNMIMVNVRHIGAAVGLFAWTHWQVYSYGQSHNPKNFRHRIDTEILFEVTASLG